MRLSTSLVWLIWLILGASGCAHYGTSASGEGAYRSVAIPLLDNESLEAGLQQAMTDTLIQTFVTNGAIRVLDEDQAQLVLRGTVTRVLDQPFTLEGGSEQFRIIVRLDVSCYDTSEKTSIWEERGLRGFGIYDAGADRREAREAALGEAMAMLAGDIVDRTQVGGW